MISIPDARKLMQLTDLGWKFLSKEEFLQIVNIYGNAANRTEKEMSQLENNK